MNQLSQFDKSIIIAAKAHSGDTDKGGKHYMFHVMRVAMNVEKVREYPIFKDLSDEIVEKVRCVCILHDVIEDTATKARPVTAQSLRDEGMDEEIIAGVEGMTRREGESYRDFIERAKQNPISRMGKACDLMDNMDESRLKDSPSEVRAAAKKRIKKRYRPALERVLGIDDKSIYEFIHAINHQKKEPIISDDSILSFIEKNIELTTQQKAAIHMALRSNVSVLSGASGTGVTFTLKAIISCLETAKPNANIIIVSGTGRKRAYLSQQLGKEVKSIYQLSKDELIGDLIVIDDPQMMKRQALVETLQRIPNIRILFVGNSQPFSMEDGIQLEEIVKHARIPHTVLTQKFRQ
ncbi:hypothetical protein JOD82_002018 [Paenibacillus sp. 1182]|uniref:AAA family ATPase n=1 Tax=Paenibacillus sp. 1182 TaxID=2806565 RepID=UPI001AE8D7EE|nr:AAA family ATPase [Paenibacillus sp. 1182]MBP1308998.1 hypothetical protein [Paenibacillus sp. 1182]